MIDLWITYQFLRKLTTPFSEWPAYKVGVIDENGVILKKAKNRLSKEEQASFTKFDLLVLKFKTLLEKIPGGNTKFGSYTTALWLIKENSATSFNELYSNQQQQYFQKLID